MKWNRGCTVLPRASTGGGRSCAPEPMGAACGRFRLLPSPAVSDYGAKQQPGQGSASQQADGHRGYDPRRAAGSGAAPSNRKPAIRAARADRDKQETTDQVRCLPLAIDNQPSTRSRLARRAAVAVIGKSEEHVRIGAQAGSRGRAGVGPGRAFMRLHRREKAPCSLGQVDAAARGAFLG